MLNIIGVSVLLGLISPLAAIRCLNPVGPCKCYTDQGFIDLSPLDSTNGHPRFQIENDDDNAIYSYNPCSAFSLSSCGHSLTCKTETDSQGSHGDGHKSRGIVSPRFRRFNGYERVSGPKNKWLSVKSLFLPHDSYSLGRPVGYQWANSDIYQVPELPPDSREHDDDEHEHIFINLIGNSQNSHVVRTSSIKLVCSDHHEAWFTMTHADKSYNNEHYTFTLASSHACPKPGEIPTGTPLPDHPPTHAPNPEPEPNPEHGDFGNFQYVDDSEVVLSKRNLVIAAISLALLLILVILSSMYCTLICCMPKKNAKSKPKDITLYTIPTNDTEKKEMFA